MAVKTATKHKSSSKKKTSKPIVAPYIPPPPVPPPPPPVAPIAPPATPNVTDTTARDILRSLFSSYGFQGNELASITDWAWEQQRLGAPQEVILNQFYERPEYKARFPYMAAVRASGRAIDEGTAVQYERQYIELLRAAGVSPGSVFETVDAIGEHIINNTSINEVQMRLQTDLAKVRTAPPEVKAYYESIYGPASNEAMLHTFLDVNMAEPTLERMANQAVFGGTGRQLGFNVNADLAMRAGENNIGQAEARAGFLQAQGLQPLTAETISESTDLTPDQLVAGQFGLSPDAKKAVERRQESRQAAFSGVGGVQTSNQGARGLGVGGQ